MDEQEMQLRVEALRIAAADTHDMTAEGRVAMAEEYFKFLSGGTA